MGYSRYIELVTWVYKPTNISLGFQTQPAFLLRVHGIRNIIIDLWDHRNGEKSHLPGRYEEKGTRVTSLPNRQVFSGDQV